MDPDLRRRVEEVCDLALNRDPAERAALLAAECANNKELRQAVEELLEHTPAAKAFLAHRADRPSSGSNAPDDAVSASLCEGARLGRYEIESFIGAGGMGEVYRAHDPALDRAVAIKVLRSPFSADPAFRARLSREAKAISRLSHPGICKLYDIGHQGGIDYLVMEYLNGETLAERLRRSPHGLPLCEALDHARAIATALHEAHRNGIAHRDVKPANIFLRRSDPLPDSWVRQFGLSKRMVSQLDERFHHATLVDFGMATHPSLVASPDLTATGTMLGTFQYMAPEQRQGREADARTDIFAFGAVLFEMLTGKKACQEKGHIAAAIAHTTRQLVLHPAIVNVNVRTILEFDIGYAIEKCPAKRPEERWQSIADLRDEISGYLMSLPYDMYLADDIYMKRLRPEASRGVRYRLLALAMRLIRAGMKWLGRARSLTVRRPDVNGA